jgi:hypothetical protein
MMAMSLTSPTFYIGHIRIGSVEGASCVNIGNNWPCGFESYKKHTQGFGEVGGDHNRLTGARSAVSDSELIDMLNMSDDADIPDWLQEIVEKTARATVG